MDEKKESVTKKREAAYGGATGATIAVAGTAAAITVFLSPAGVILARSIIAASVTAFQTAIFAFPIAAGITEGAIVPKTKKEFDEKIKKVRKFVERLEEIPPKNKRRTQTLTEKVNQLRNIKSVAGQTQNIASLVSDVDDIMFDMIKKGVKKLECLCDTYLKN